ncbi:hypothetical protein Bb109J_c1038 [Bdellovibrio bacteriovorus]|nr:hypothetical protein Bb109J_c1038 [Bdellovibrio bacteriovorus]
MQYKKTQVGYKAPTTNGEIAFRILFTTMVFGILVTYFTK